MRSDPAGPKPAKPSCRQASDGPRGLVSGEVLCEAGQTGPVWRVLRGALRLDLCTREGLRFVQIARPGDCIGLEQLAGVPIAFAARALVPTEVQACRFTTDEARRAALLEGMLQQQARIADLVTLRTGPARHRLQQLLLMLAEGAAGRASAEVADRDLPTIKDVAAIIDTSPETVSRVFGEFRRHHRLDARQRRGARFSPARLGEPMPARG